MNSRFPDSERGLAVVMPVYVDSRYRLKLLENCCRSLAATRLPPGWRVSWTFYDDASPLAWQHCLAPLAHLDPQVRRLPGLGANGNCVRTLSTALAEMPVAVSVEMDMVVHPDWLSELLALRARRPEGAAWTCFNAKFHPPREVLPGGDLRKATLSGNVLMVDRAGWVIPATDPEQIKAECGHLTWDWSFLHRAGVLAGRKPVYCTPRSYAQHHGIVGYSFGEGLLDYDRALDFVGESAFARTLVPVVWLVCRSDLPFATKRHLVLAYPKCGLKRLLGRLKKEA